MVTVGKFIVAWLIIIFGTYIWIGSFRIMVWLVEIDNEVLFYLVSTWSSIVAAYVLLRVKNDSV